MRGCNNQIFNMLLITRTMAAIVFVSVKRKMQRFDVWLQQRSASLRQATTNQIFMLHWERKWWSQNNHIVDTMIMPYVMLLEATTMVTTVDCGKSARLRNNNPLFSHWQSQRCKVPTMRLIAMPWCKCQWHDNHFFMSYCKEQQQ